MTGFNLPPGCNVSDLPGNSPEDEKREIIEDLFFQDEINDMEWKQIEQQYEIVCKAIWYGYNVGMKEQESMDAENKYYSKEYFNMTKLPKLRKYFKEQRYLIDYLKAELDGVKYERM